MKLNFTPEKVNPEQRATIAAVDGPSLVIAGPGSGKTRNLGGLQKYAQCPHRQGFLVSSLAIELSRTSDTIRHVISRLSSGAVKMFF